MKRECGACTLCCRLLPVPEFGKPAGERCRHQFSKGCRIYHKRPQSCAFWNCRWLAGDDTGLRPDRAHYVVDMMPDFVVQQPVGAPENKIPVLQIWCDGTPVEDDPRLLAYIAAEGERNGMCGLLRLPGNGGALFIAPPAVTGDGRWFKVLSIFNGPEHSFAEIAAAQPRGSVLDVVVPRDRIGEGKG
jgi:hypothetical protein